MKLVNYTSADDQVRGFTQEEIKQIQLDAMKEGMRRAAEIVKHHQPTISEIGYRTAILSAAENLTEKDLL